MCRAHGRDGQWFLLSYSKIINTSSSRLMILEIKAGSYISITKAPGELKKVMTWCFLFYPTELLGTVMPVGPQTVSLKEKGKKSNPTADCKVTACTDFIQVLDGNKCREEQEARFILCLFIHLFNISTSQEESFAHVNNYKHEVAFIEGYRWIKKT